MVRWASVLVCALGAMSLFTLAGEANSSRHISPGDLDHVFGGSSCWTNNTPTCPPAANGCANCLDLVPNADCSANGTLKNVTQLQANWQDSCCIQKSGLSCITALTSIYCNFWYPCTTCGWDADDNITCLNGIQQVGAGNMNYENQFTNSGSYCSGN